MSESTDRPVCLICVQHDRKTCCIWTEGIVTDCKVQLEQQHGGSQTLVCTARAPCNHHIMPIRCDLESIVCRHGLIIEHKAESSNQESCAEV